MHDHTHQDTSDSARRLKLALLLTGAFMVVEVIGGIVSGSLALLADAGHMLTDTAALGLALVASYVAERPADRKRTFGYHRVQILAAFVNSLTLIAIVGWILFEAVRRLLSPEPVLAGAMLAVAVAGLIVNLVAFRLLHGGSGDNLNVRAAALHVLGDLLGSAGAIVAALVIMTTGWTLADPLLSVLVAMLILRSAWLLLKRSAHILLEGVPDWLDLESMRQRLLDRVPGLMNIHHVHVWSLNPQRLMLTMHAELAEEADQRAALAEIKACLSEEFGITHSTVEIDLADPAVQRVRDACDAGLR